MLPEIIPGKLRLQTIFRLGWRNLRRNRRRTWITATTVALALFLLQISMSLLIGIEQQSFDNLINYQTSHAKLFASGYFDNRDEFPLDKTLSDPESLEEELRAVDGVAAVTPRLVFSAQLSNGVDQYPCLGTGIQIAGSDADVFRISQAVVDGSYLTPDEEGLLLGSGLAGLFDADVGDWLTVLTKTRAGAYEALDLPVVGLLGTGDPLIDQGSFLLPLKTARYMLEMENEVTEIDIRFKPTAWEVPTLTRVREAMEKSGSVEVKGWREIEENFLAFARLKRTVQGIFLSIFVILAVVGIANTVLMAAFERTKEIGMLMAMGLRAAGIRRLFLAEGALAGLLGGALGTLLALVLIIWFANRGIDLTALYGDIDIGYPVKDTLYPGLNLVALVLAWLSTGLLAALASLYPASRASRKDPVEALRHV